MTPDPLRTIDDVETLKAISDPLRLRILGALLDGFERGAPVMSAKEIAEVLGESQTKLYRHLRQLEAQRLIVVAESRVVSGITEQRYRVTALRFDLGPALLATGPSTEDSTALVSAALEQFRGAYLAALRSGGVVMGARYPADESYRQATINNLTLRVPAERAGEFRDRLTALVDEMVAEPRDPDGVLVHFFAGWFSPPIGD